MGKKSKGSDHVDMVLSQWLDVSPDRDTSPMAIFTRLLRLSKYYTRYISKVFHRHGLNTGGFDLLATLYRNGQPQGLTPNELLDQVVLSSGAMTNRLDRLENAGLIQRVPNQEDRRSVLIRLTATGSKTMLASLDDYLEALRKLQASLTNRQKADLANALKILLLELET
jgi:DNA-binding MarR family transcriptional regulator